MFSAHPLSKGKHQQLKSLLHSVFHVFSYRTQLCHWSKGCDTYIELLKISMFFFQKRNLIIHHHPSSMWKISSSIILTIINDFPQCQNLHHPSSCVCVCVHQLPKKRCRKPKLYPKSGKGEALRYFGVILLSHVFNRRNRAHQNLGILWGLELWRSHPKPTMKFFHVSTEDSPKVEPMGFF